MRNKIRQLIAEGVYDQHAIFGQLYPTYHGHYAKLRDMISEEKNNDANRTAR